MVRLQPHSFVPPYILEKLAASDDERVRGPAVRALEFAADSRTMRVLRSEAPQMNAIPSAGGTKERRVHDMKHRSQWHLPGTLLRSEGGETSVSDVAANEAYDSCGEVYDFYLEELGRNSLDGKGMVLITSVHVNRNYSNAFWNGEQMAYGDGDGIIFNRFTKAVDVAGHELTHGVVANTSNLVYTGESGALNEHFADVFGVLIKQRSRKQNDARTADWLVGADVIVPRRTMKAVRTFTEAPAYKDDEYLGTDPQPKHYKDKYEGGDDNCGVHINSGIPNHAFYRVATSLGGKAWGRPGKIWYRTLLTLAPQSEFSDMVRESIAAAVELHGRNSPEHRAVANAWECVGLSPGRSS
jgi:Zn-dependent metalloprotease